MVFKTVAPGSLNCWSNSTYRAVSQGFETRVHTPVWAPKLGAQKIINDINPKEQSTQSAPTSHYNFRVLKNPQNAGNGISKTLNFKNFRAGHAL